MFYLFLLLPNGGRECSGDWGAIPRTEAGMGGVGSGGVDVEGSNLDDYLMYICQLLYENAGEVQLERLECLVVD